jgi:hypothetical protein
MWIILLSFLSIAQARHLMDEIDVERYEAGV